jgi:hypothetical protein
LGISQEEIDTYLSTIIKTWLEHCEFFDDRSNLQLPATPSTSSSRSSILLLIDLTPEHFAFKGLRPFELERKSQRHESHGIK